MKTIMQTKKRKGIIQMVKIIMEMYGNNNNGSI